MKFFIMSFFLTHLAFGEARFRGNVKNSSLPCSLEVQKTYYLDNIFEPQNFRAEVRVEIQSDDHSLGNFEEFFFTLRPGSRPQLFSGVSHQDQLNVMARAGSRELGALDFFAIKWWHGNHFHSLQCVNLKRD